VVVHLIAGEWGCARGGSGTEGPFSFLPAPAVRAPMTIVPFLRDNVFGPRDIQAMSTALDDVCKILNVADEIGSERELVAKKIIGFAHQGQRDAGFLRDRMLREIVSGRGEWPAALVRAAQCGAL
jgi:hypothetical protein